MNVKKYISQPAALFYRSRDACAELLLRNKLLKGNTEYQKFIILGWYRTGSNLLINSLSSHPLVIAYSELFHPPRILWADGVFGLSENKPLLIKKRNTDPQAFFSEQVFRNYPSYIKSVGFKIFYSHLENDLFSEIGQEIKKIENLKIIHLRRRNLFGVYVSKEIAARRKIMTETSAKRAEANTRALGLLHCSAAEVEDFFIRLNRQAGTYASFFPTTQTMNIFYEDLISDYDSQLEKIQRFLNLPPRKLHTVLVKQNTMPFNQLISNYSELQSYFKNTEWKFFFEETA